MTDDLLHDLTTAERGSRELSDRFLLAMGWEPVDIAKAGFPPRYAMIRPDGQIFVTFRPSPTEDMQDTIEAVPEEWSLKLIIHPDITYAELYLLGEYKDGNRPILRQHEDEARKPQLAACAAILKAKGAQDGS